MQYILNHQLEILFVLECFCLLQAIFGFVMKIEPKEKKRALILVEIFVMILLLADRNTYIYQGNTSQMGYYMTRISNFLVYAMNYFILDAYNIYIISVLRQLGNQEKQIEKLKLVRPLALVGIILIIVSQFTGLYYTFDANNVYHRGSGFVICYILPLVIMIFQLVVFTRIRKQLRRNFFISIFVFSVAPLIASIMQIFTYGISLSDMVIALSAIVLYVLVIADQNEILFEANKKEIDSLKEINTVAKEQFKQTVLALATAIDAKDEYTHGHSRRVAEYSKRIAQDIGKNEEMCEKVYFAALLHDVGKIGIADSILTKEGKLTEEEFDIIKQHPDLGNNILKEISSTPYLAVGAHFHHEKYNGTGYPMGLKGEAIPEMARIIAVADAYDAMTSSRSYRTPLAQQKVREELAKGVGTQFDPEYARAMIHILDEDIEYALREEESRFAGFSAEYKFDEYKIQSTDGIRVSNCITRISFSYESLENQEDCVPSIVVFDSLDEHVYLDEANQKKMDYTSFCDISFLGDFKPEQIRDFQIKEYTNDEKDTVGKNVGIIETLKQRDHLWIKLILSDVIREYTIALRDRSQFVFTAITGKKCKLRYFQVHVVDKPVEENFIPRIAEEISYIKDRPVGDLKNVEIAGWREDHTEGVLINNKMDISFHTMSLPAAKRLWHCPLGIIYSSEDGEIYGPDYREFALIRFNGESWEEDATSSNEMKVSFGKEFGDWEDWKRANRQGVDCTIHIEKKKNKIFLTAEDSGILMENVTTINEEVPKLYFALTGDQIAITTVCIKEQKMSVQRKERD